MKKRMLGILLMCCIALTLFPTAAFAADGETTALPQGTDSLCEHHTLHDETCGNMPKICESENGGADPVDPAEEPAKKCVCGTLCTEDKYSAVCPVCCIGGADLTLCNGEAEAAAPSNAQENAVKDRDAEESGVTAGTPNKAAGLAATQYTYVLHYDGYGGANVPPDEVVYSAERNVWIPVSSMVPVRDGYIFEGWASRPNGKVLYKYGDDRFYSSVLVPYDLVPVTTTTIYAIWKENPEPPVGAVTPQLRISAVTNEWEVSYDNGGSWTSLGVKATGEKGERGAGGKDGKDGADGKDGITPQLEIGDDSIWQISYDGGQTWTSLGVKATGEKGEQGADGKDGKDGADGKNGTDGQDGLTPQLRIGDDNIWQISYDGGQTWTSLGVKATGEKGEQGADGQDGLVPYIGANGNWWLGDTDTGIRASVKGEKGEKGGTGAAGRNGADGKNGKDGVGISKAEINADGELVLTYTDGTMVNLGKVVGADGRDGLTPFIGENGNWWIGETDTGVKAAADTAVTSGSGTAAKKSSAATAAIVMAGISLLGNLALVFYIVLKKEKESRLG